MGRLHHDPSRTEGGPMAWLSNDDSKRIRDDKDESALKRLSQVLSSINRVEDADPEEVEARIRNLSHGTNRDSG